MRRIAAIAGTVAVLASPFVAPQPVDAAQQWQTTKATWYRGQRGACGPLRGHYAAHRTLPCGTKLRVTRGSRSITVEILDRGPYVHGVGIDLSKGAFEDLAPPSQGVITVEWKKTGTRR